MRKHECKALSATQARGVADVTDVVIDGDSVIIKTAAQRRFSVSVADVVKDWSKRLKHVTNGDLA